VSRNPLFVIWSIEHEAFWRPGRMGYTTTLRDAGTYSALDAAAILRRANAHARDVCEVAIPVGAIFEGLEHGCTCEPGLPECDGCRRNRLALP
jgi:hypothetical protein